MPEEKPTPQQEISPELIAQFLKALTDRANQPKDISVFYANNTSFEVSAWDLKIFFGTLDQRAPNKPEIDWQAAVTIPWSQARVLEYYLRSNIAFYEKRFGPINLPPQIRPPAPIEPEDQLKADPQARELWETYKKIHEEMFGPTA